MTRASDTARLVSGGAVFNEASNDVDFRVESNGNANMLVVNAGDDRVGIGTNAPASPLHISGSNGVLATLGATTELEIYVNNNEISFTIIFVYDGHRSIGIVSNGINTSNIIVATCNTTI